LGVSGPTSRSLGRRLPGVRDARAEQHMTCRDPLQFACAMHSDSPGRLAKQLLYTELCRRRLEPVPRSAGAAVVPHSDRRCRPQPVPVSFTKRSCEYRTRFRFAGHGDILTRGSSHDTTTHNMPIRRRAPRASHRGPSSRSRPAVRIDGWC
jgi:hypothetical protein